MNQFVVYLPILEGENQLVQFVLECTMLPCRPVTLSCSNVVR